MLALAYRSRTTLTRRTRLRKRVSVRRRASGRAHYNYFRDYDPAIGRYAEADPIGIKGGLNLYQYAYDQPTKFSDPMGQNPAAAALCFVPGVGWVSCTAAAVGVAVVAGVVYLSTRSPAQATSTSTYANCPDPDECKRLNEEVQQAKKEVGRLGGCRPGMSPAELAARYGAWVREGVARARRDQKCFNGGDEGHQQAQAAAWQAMGVCLRLIDPYGF